MDHNFKGNSSLKEIIEDNSLVQSVNFNLLGKELGKDLETTLQKVIDGGVLFPKGSDPLSIFRATLETSIRDIESHPKGILFQQFLLKGPYDDEGKIPRDKIDKYISDEDTTKAIAFIYSYMINSFKGAITELFALEPCLKIMKQLQLEGRIPSNANLYSGDTVFVKKLDGKGYAKGADFHILLNDSLQTTKGNITLLGVGEIKSYFKSPQLLHSQIEKHIQRFRNGFRIGNDAYLPELVTLGYGKSHNIIHFLVQPSTWKLSREFHFEKNDKGRLLHTEPTIPPQSEHLIMRTNDNEWNITLKWSKEALAEAAYEMTFWYMGKVGEIIFSQKGPKSLHEMTPEEAGRNAIKMMLYYAIRRCRTDRQSQRAIALYNSYCFGYSLGMNFKDSDGRREMLWIEDLDDILTSGKTKYESKIYK